jgi:hypothetical protein
MSYKIIKTADFNKITKDTIRLKNVCKTSSVREIYSMDVYLLDNNKRCPLLIETPVLTIGSNIFNRNSHNYFFIALRHLEYDKSIQNFYRLITNLEYSIIRSLLQYYELSQTYSNNMLLDVEEQLSDVVDYNFFINTDKYVSISVEYKKEVSTVYDRFKKRYSDEEYLDKITKHSRGQFILELPSIWFELDSNKKVIKIGFNWLALQTKLLDVCIIEKCLIEDEVPLAPPPPPIFIQQPNRPIHPMMGLFGGGIPKINPNDLLGGIGGLKKGTVNEGVKPVKVIQGNGFKPPSLNDILSTLKSLKKKDTVECQS